MLGEYCGCGSFWLIVADYHEQLAFNYKNLTLGLINSIL